MKKYILSLMFFGALAGITSSCEDMLDKGNDYVIYADGQELNNPGDTVTSVLGILNKLQAIAVRTNLLGELRADLVTVRDNANSDLKDIASFEISDENKYNAPRDYYAVINNCNFFLERADSTAGNTNRNEKYFEAEIAQVHSIRAWTYLQMVLVYGRVPFIDKPVLTKLQSDAQYPMYELDDICDYFINDLKPYYGREYPEYVGIGGDIDPKLCFYPTQIVMGDLYLWKAAKNHDKEAAKQAAKCYYDYIVWDLNGKRKMVTSNRRAYWTENNLFWNRYSFPSYSMQFTPSGAWGANGQEFVTAIPMDSAAADGYYNELRTLYNTQYQTALVEASIEPSKVIRDLSKAQTYVGYGVNNGQRKIVTVTADNFTDEEIADGYLGDLRFYAAYSQRTTKYNSDEVDLQFIYKHQGQHVGIYRSAQIYLRMAEALNYAGYPRFAKQILTMGLSNTVIQNMVQPYYTTTADSAFIQYFDFNNIDFLPYAAAYSEVKNEYGIRTAPADFTPRSELSSCNMWGIHSRGSGLAFLDEDYAPFHAVDSDRVDNPYPRAKEALVGTRPLKNQYNYPKAPTEVRKPSTWESYPNVVVSQAVYLTLNPQYTTTQYRNYITNDSVGKYQIYISESLPAYVRDTTALYAVYSADLNAYNSRLTDFLTDYDTWYRKAYNSTDFIAKEQDDIDQLILTEQALELVFEGNRFYDLMRRAYWYNDNSILANAVGNRDAALTSKLMNRNSWFLKWNNKIGY